MPPRQATEVCVVQVEEVLRCTGRGAALAVLHHAQPQRTPLPGQQTICNVRAWRVTDGPDGTGHEEQQH